MAAGYKERFSCLHLDVLLLLKQYCMDGTDFLETMWIAQVKSTLAVRWGHERLVQLVGESGVHHSNDVELETLIQTYRRRQRRCVVKRSDIACIYCMQHHLDCSLTSKQAQVAETRSQSRIGPQTSQSSPQLPPLDLQILIASAYFNYVHNPTQQIFHEPSFMNELATGQTPKPVVFCLIAIAAR